MKPVTIYTIICNLGHLEGDKVCPLRIIDTIREAKNEYDIKFDSITFTFGTSGGWYDCGYFCPDFDVDSIFEFSSIFDFGEFPTEIATTPYCVQSVCYDNRDNSLEVTFIGTPSKTLKPNKKSKSRI